MGERSSKTPSRKEIDRMKLLPAFLPKNIDSKEKLDKLLDSLEDAYKPDFSED